jgi:1,5-rhamnosyltransferase
MSGLLNRRRRNYQRGACDNLSHRATTRGAGLRYLRSSLPVDQAQSAFRVYTLRTFFLGWTAQYERRFIRYLANHHSVSKLEVPKLLKRLHRLATGFSKSAAVQARQVPWLGRLYCAAKGFKSSDILVCNEGQVRRNVLPSIVSAFPGRRILLVRDLVDAAFIEEMTPFFDRIYSFDQSQCSRLGMQHLNQFFPVGFAEAEQLAAKDAATGAQKHCFFLGRDKGRSALLDRLAGVLEQLGCKADFHIVRDSTSTPASRFHTDTLLDYETNLQMSLAADVLIEINQPGQAGFTLRTLEAAYFGKKLITSNASVKDTALYHPNNIFVIEGDNHWNAAALGEFLDVPFEPLPKETLYAYSPDHMLEQLTRENAGSPPLITPGGA